MWRGEKRRVEKRWLVSALALALSVPVGLAPSAQAADGALGRPKLPGERVSKVEAIETPGAKASRRKVAMDRKTNIDQAARARTEQQARWPGKGSATVALSDGEAGSATPAGVPVRIEPRPVKSGAAAPGEVRVTVLDQSAARRTGVTGVVLTAEADTAGAAELSLDYGAFASAIGGGWSQRLRLVTLPTCALTTPDKPACRTQTPVRSQNDSGRQTVSAELTFPGSAGGPATQLASNATATSGATVLAMTAAGGSGQSPKGSGDYTATSLSESSSWSAGEGSGAFSWSYDFSMPPAAAGPTPLLSLAYDSGGVDGRTATTNNQGTSIGEGFEFTESYIERAYGSCDDDGHKDVFDRCWKYDNAQLVLNGKSNRLVKDSTSGEWRLEGDDASKVTRSTGADNGDDNGEYWTVVTGEGVSYTFGRNKLEGANTQRTNSTWTVPVFGDDSGEPGYADGVSFAGRAKTQAWRWNLDLVEDTSGNAATYWYTKETNHYRKNNAAKAETGYTRGGHLDTITYGLRSGALFSDAADAKVTFGYAERCTAKDCTSLTKETSDNWPDVPFDVICADGDADCDGYGPTFFTRKRMTGVHTFSWNATTSAYDPVDSWAFTQEYLDGGDIGDTSDQSLTLRSIKRTGKAGTAIETKPVSFTYQMRPNRVDGTDDILPLTRPRISTITSETGAITTVTLSAPECVRSAVLGAAEDTNTRSCYPQFWNINGAEDASVDWFHKYRVLAVTVSDPAGQNDVVENSYDYAGAAWHHNDEPFTPSAERTWSVWRGYRQVTAYSGALKTTRSKTVSLYLQGMDGDKKKDGTTKSVTVAPLSRPVLGAAGIKDAAPYAGQLREQVTYDGATAISAVVNEPWSKETARQTVPGAGDLVARFVRTRASTAYTYLTAPDDWRSRTVTTDYDDLGMAYRVDDRGDDARAGDESCTRTWYARDTAEGLTALPSRTRVVGRACDVTDGDLDLPADASRRGDVLSDTAVGYDGATTWSASMKPVKGLATWGGRASGYDTANAPTWQKTVAATHDVLGRPLVVSNADGKSLTTAYTPATAGPLTRTAVTDAKGHTEVDFLDPRRGLSVRSYDANLKKTEFTHDAMGRLTGVWLPNRNKAAGDVASQTFGYNLSNTKQSWVSTSTLRKDGTGYNTSYAIYDSLMRPLQSQSPTPEGGRLLNDTRYDSRGLVYETHADIFDSTSAPNGTYTRAEYGESPTQTNTEFDGAGRPVSTQLMVFGEARWTTSTSYTGDSTAGSAPAGGSATRTITDARGRTIETRSYAGGSPADPGYGGAPGATYASTKFTHGLDGQETSVDGPDGARWTYGYDLFGRLTSSTDPDKGLVTSEYNALDQVVEVSDARGTSLLTAYDEIGRVTGTWTGSKTDANQLTGITYDTVLKGLPTASTRYVGGRAGKAYTKSVTAYDSLSRPTATKLSLPADDPFVKAGAPTSLEYTSYFNLDGTLQNAKEPALGGLPSETVSYGYDVLGNVTSVGGSTGYLLDTDYSALGQAQQLVLGTANTEAVKKTYVTNTFEEGTGRLTRSHVTDQTHPYMLQDLNYSYDNAGNVTSIADPTTLGGSGKAETQCFAYDGHRRMTEAWTPSSQKCSDPRSATALSGPAPYWTSYTYDTAGQRTSQTSHRSTGDTRTTYCYTAAQPHALTGTSAKNDCTAPDRVFGYDRTGNTTKRPGETGPQDLDWSPEGRLAKLTADGKATDYLYDAAGALLVRATAGGERVLYAGATELHLRSDGTLWAQRAYTSGDLTVAVRSNESGTNRLAYLAGDRHGTQSLAVSADDSQPYSKRYMSPFGAERGTPTGGPWPDDRGFLGKTADETTGLTHLGAREYDPDLGRFMSVDPLLETSKPQSLNGYGYAESNPATLTDPSGMGSFKCSSDCSEQVRFQEEHMPPSLWSGETWEEKYPNYPKEKVTIRSKPPVGMSAAAKKAWKEALKKVESKGTWFGNGANTQDGLAAMSELFWETFCSKAESECPKDRPAATALGDFGLRQHDTGLGMRLEPQAASAGLVGITTAAAMKLLMDPEHLRGQTAEYIHALAEKAGMSSAPMKPTSATGGKGTRFFVQGDPDVMLFYEVGDPAVKDKVHQGPYVKYQIRGEGKDGAVRVPLSGNPHPLEGGRVPTTTAQRIADFLMKTRRR
ncbi:RHS repeat domain-containing protein [Streptomyces sp. NPDC049936]|uniref:RHS repeat domain-containing protein n=1 Tax=Streptomyces sp. NPDC049936 TaxID=3365599 RepID=UPI0037A86518